MTGNHFPSYFLLSPRFPFLSTFSPRLPIYLFESRPRHGHGRSAEKSGRFYSSVGSTENVVAAPSCLCSWRNGADTPNSLRKAASGRAAAAPAPAAVNRVGGRCSPRHCRRTPWGDSGFAAAALAIQSCSRSRQEGSRQKAARRRGNCRRRRRRRSHTQPREGVWRRCRRLPDLLLLLLLLGIVSGKFPTANSKPYRAAG